MNNQNKNDNRIGAEELHNILDDVIRGLQAGSMERGLAKEISNAAGKKIGLVKVQIDYANMWGGKIEVPFLITSKLTYGRVLKEKV